MGRTAVSPYTVASRMERLPFTHWHWRLLAVLSICWLAEAIDIGLSGATIPSLKSDFGLTASGVGLVGTATTITIVIALFVAGPVIDRYGKRRVLIIGLLVFGVSTIMTAFSPSIEVVIGLRIVAGVGLGLLFTIPYQIIVEMVPTKVRGASVGAVNGVLNLGYFGNLLAASFIIPSFGWRPMYLLGAVGLFACFIAWRTLPESPRWLEAKGRHEEAEITLAKLELAVARSYRKPLPEPARGVETITGRRRAPLGELFKGKLRWRTIWLWTVVSCLWSPFYLFSIYLPTMLVQEGLALSDALLTAAVVNAVPIPTHILGAWLLEKVGRRLTITTYAGISVVGVFIFAFVRSYPAAFVGAALGLGFMAAAFSFTKLVAAEQYPTRLRGSGTTFTEAIGRGIAGIVVPLVLSGLIINHGVPAASTLAIALGIIGLILYAAFARETRGVVLEDLDESLPKRTSPATST